ncbi:cytochrome P450 [Daedalea quercina L-15889]|uniref:Cytochrome P450 n=1 Tax=Daedalea quercina L-15889 TaxID=1314783 RepID=A0A165NEJ3_9APHY|nr:cytochrome P450 [Daedalea quercina L-15889]
MATLGVVVALCIAAGLLWHLAQNRVESGLAPGPIGIPLLGNAWRLPAERSWIYLHSLCEQYGPIVGLRVFGNNMLVLDKLEDVQELLVKRSQNYSSRKPMVYAGKYRSSNERIVMLPYGPMLKKQRAAMHQMLNPKVVGAYDDLLEDAAMKLLSAIVADPSKPYISLKRFTSETLFTLIYGTQFGENNEDLRTILHIIETMIQDMHPFGHVVDMLPILDRLPDVLAPWRVEARRKNISDFQFYSRLLRDVKQKMDANTHVECFAARLWDSAKYIGIDERTMAYVAGSAFEGGTDNTAGVVLWFLVLALHFPAAVKKAQAELNEVLGSDGRTPPSFAHIGQLPNCVALVKEVFRWMPTAPLSFPHFSMKDDVYKGIKISAGTNVIPNIWAIHHDEELYPEPFEFKPERFLASTEDVRTDSLNEGHYAFGFGRRICPGQYFASKSAWIAIVRLAWAFNIDSPLGVNGNPILPDLGACRAGLTAEPKPFDVILTPRSAGHVQAIVQGS